MSFRVVTLNLEQDHKRWERRLQTARGLGRTADAASDRTFNLVQQTRVNGLSEVEGEALLAAFPVRETGNLDFRRLHAACRRRRGGLRSVLAVASRSSVAPVPGS